MFKSIRSRFTMIYFLLIFIAMIIAGVFIIRSFEDYNLNVASERLDDIAQIMLTELAKIQDGDLIANKNVIQASIDNHADIGLREEIYVIEQSTQQIVASSAEVGGRAVSDILSDALVVEGLLGNVMEKNIQISDSVRTKDKVYPIIDDDQLRGIIYLRYDLKDIYSSLSTTRRIILQAILTSLCVTIVISYFLSKSITDPINEITAKASKLAEGDFSQMVEVRSEDEIGELSKTFNFLSTALKASISEISSEKSKLEAIIEYMEDGLVAINAEGEIIHNNPKALALFGVEAIENEDIVGDLLSVYSSGRLSEDIGTKNITYRDKILKVNFAPYLDDSLQKAGAVFVLTDITEEERLENMRREFVANVSHELKTPLTSIKSYTETILEGMVDDPETEKTFLEVVNSEADRMSRLVRDLLELTSFDSASVKLKYAQHNINRLISNCILKVKVTADQKRQAIVKRLVDEPISAEFDYDKIEQLVLNILSNAIKYSGEEGIIEIDLKSYEKTFDLVIKDNGIGIPEEDMNRIFERFYRVDKARSRMLGGTGLGLSIAKEIAEAHGGAIGIQSVYGHGTVVTINLPYTQGVGNSETNVV
ncbi:HAMP domain-containing protein [Fusibacter paucivorans]|uniref:histidine kinase n=1 Tax=Fusibacter paucivorans TaxID=76009 RepID=A0ABS5PQK2_9FIRM|nr:ATP-binding protein [Fusibacter paucivorans]MBS7527202.1 HAMP domain-containing protein [Fusibacter paucivorans]